jgi:tetratricopeptide (TPR) repeat protein
MSAKDAWVEIRSPHFTVYCEDGEREARTALEGFEAIRSVFGQVFAGIRVDPPRPMVVIVTHNEASMRGFLPASFEGKDPVRHAGYFQSGMDRDYALLRLDVPHQTDQPYFVLFHEYAHSIIHLNFPSLPTWLDEGLADFYGATERHGNQVYLGRVPLDRLATLRSGKLLPLASLLTATQDSPYYQERTKSGTFYAESWALVHYLFLDEKANQAGLFRAYLKALDHPVPPLDQAREGLGNLESLEKALSAYIRRPALHYLTISLPPDPKRAKVQARALDKAEVLTIQAEFLMNTRQEPASRPLLAQALTLDPKRPEVHVALGMGALLRGEQEAAFTDLEMAQRLGSRDFRVPYHLAMLAQAGVRSGSVASTQILAWLEEARTLFPDFPGTWMALCRQYAMAPRDQKKAMEAGRRALDLEPRNLVNWMNFGSTCMALDLEPAAKEVGNRLKRMASDSTERQLAEAYALQLDRFEADRQQRLQPPGIPTSQATPGMDQPLGPPRALKLNLPSNLAPLGQEVLLLLNEGKLDEAIRKVEGARKRVASGYERNSLKALLNLLQGIKANRPAPSGPPDSASGPR